MLIKKYKDLDTETELELWTNDKYASLQFRNFSLNFDGSLTEYQRGFFYNYEFDELEEIYKKMRWHFNYKVLDETNYTIKQKLVILLSKVAIKKDGTITMPFYEFFLKKMK